MNATALSAALLTALSASLASLRAQDWFKAPLHLDAQPGLIRLAGDVDGDGDVDLIRCNGAAFTVMVNNGRSAFADAGTYALPDSPNHVVFADPNFGLPGLTLYTQPIVTTLGMSLSGVTGNAGAGRADLPLNVPAGFTGLRPFFQAFVFDTTAASSVAFSNGLELLVGQ